MQYTPLDIIFMRPVAQQRYFCGGSPAEQCPQLYHPPKYAIFTTNLIKYNKNSQKMYKLSAKLGKLTANIAFGWTCIQDCKTLYNLQVPEIRALPPPT